MAVLGRLLHLPDYWITVSLSDYCLMFVGGCVDTISLRRHYGTRECLRTLGHAV